MTLFKQLYKKKTPPHTSTSLNGKRNRYTKKVDLQFEALSNFLHISSANVRAFQDITNLGYLRTGFSEGFDRLNKCLCNP